MKTLNLFFLIVLLLGLTNCNKDENENISSELKFCANGDISNVVVNYDEIIGYDSTKHIFRIKESAWDKLKNEITPVTPDPNFEFSVAVDNQIIYTAKYVPGYYSYSIDDIITFNLGVPDLIYIELGYPGGAPELFTGEDLRNDLRVINQLQADNKIIEIED
jgi:hypothetical protein